MNDRFDIDRLTDANVYDQNNDKVGSIGEIYLDDQTDEPKFATVKTGLFGTKETFVPIDSATQSEDGLVVPFTKDFIKDAPNIDVDGHLDPEEERRIFEYYGLADGGTGRTDGFVDGVDGRDDADGIGRHEGDRLDDLDRDRVDDFDRIDDGDVHEGDRLDSDYVRDAQGDFDRGDTRVSSTTEGVFTEENRVAGGTGYETGRSRLRRRGVEAEREGVVPPLQSDEFQGRDSLGHETAERDLGRDEFNVDDDLARDRDLNRDILGDDFAQDHGVERDLRDEDLGRDRDVLGDDLARDHDLDRNVRDDGEFSDRDLRDDRL